MRPNGPGTDASPQKPAFDTLARRHIYEYVERRGLATLPAVRESLDVDRQTVDHDIVGWADTEASQVKSSATPPNSPSA